ncbi:MAG: hypothetical protein RJA22_2364 [Verrucomicrobiota bacterium]
MSQRRTALAVAALVLLTLLAYGRVLQCDFVNYDDNDYVTANPVVQRGLTLEGLAWAFGRLHGDKTYYHPLTWVSHMLDCQWFGLNPVGHHATSLFLHALNVVVLFLVLRRMTGTFWRSALVAALWSVHPLQVDTVAWVTERKNLLSGLFWLLAMGAYVRYAERPGWGRYAWVWLAMALGLLCKPVLVTLPAALLLLDVWPLGRVPWWGTPAGPSRFPVVTWRRALQEKLPLLALSLVSALVTVASHNALGVRDEATGLTLGLKVANAVVSYTRYLDHVVLPLGLNVLYLHPGSWPAWKIALSALLTGGVLTGLALGRARTQPFVLVGWCWFLGVLVPTIGLHQAGVQAMADRFMYLPLVGLLWAGVWLAGDWALGWRRPGRGAALVAVPVLAVLVALTVRQVGTWRSSITLWQQAVAVDPGNFIAHNNLALAWQAAGRLDQARRHAMEAARVSPPRVAYFAPRLQLAALNVLEGRPAEAQAEMAAALRLQPAAGGVVLMMVDADLAQGRRDVAAGLLEALLAAAPDDHAARARLAGVLSVERPLEAARHYEAVLRAHPDAPLFLNDLAWLRATHPQAAARQGAEAVRLAERACQLTQRREPFLLGTLAAAYAEAGRFEDAVRTGEEARGLAAARGDARLAALNEKLVSLYRARQPYRQQPLP